MIRLCWVGILGGMLLVAGSTPAVGQSSADAFFHDAAQQYVAGNVAGARQTVTQGLAAFPSDSRLQALQKKLEQTEERSGGGQPSQQGTQSQQQGEQSQGAGTDRSERSEGETESRADASSDQQSSRRPDNGSSPVAPGEENAQAPRQSPSGEGGGTNALSQAQAARLLQALENQEMKLLREVRGRVEEGESVEKDW